MKYLPHIALPALMLGLLALAMVLPKFVQPKSEEGASTRPEYAPPASIEMLPEYEPTEEDSHKKLFAEETPIPVIPTPDYDKMLKPFLGMLEAGNLDGAEKVLNAYGSKIPSGMKAGLQYSLNSARESEKALAIAKAETAKAAHATKEAEKLVKERSENEVALASAGADNQITLAALNKAKAEAERMEKARKSVEARLSKLQNESAAKIQSSLAELNKATEAAKVAAQQAERSALETAKLRAAFESTSPVSPMKKPTAVNSAKPVVPAQAIELPEGSSIQFSNNSSVLKSVANNTIKEVVTALGKESKLGIQLRGYSDSVGNAEYNAILSKARSQRVKDALVKEGIAADRIDLLPFGSSQSPRGRSANHRRVDLIFFER